MRSKSESLKKIEMIMTVLDASPVPLTSDQVSEHIYSKYFVTIFPNSISSLLASHIDKIRPRINKMKFVVEIIDVGIRSYYTKRVFYWSNKLSYETTKAFKKKLLDEAKTSPTKWKKPPKQLELFKESDLKQ